MKVIDSRVLIQPEKNTGCVQKIGGLDIRVGDEKDYEMGTVLSVGEKVDVLKEGDRVYFYSGAGKKVFQDNKEYRVIFIVI